MTPTVYGRWQTRLFLLATIGFAVTIFFGFLYTDPAVGGSSAYITTITVLLYVILFGFVWDLVYNYVQLFRWDRDWPPAYQFFAGVIEGAFIWLLIRTDFLYRFLPWDNLPGLPPGSITFRQFFWHYTFVWVLTFLASQSLMRILFPRWRYFGGQWL